MNGAGLGITPVYRSVHARRFHRKSPIVTML
jgi:hypothetical protein